MQYDANKNIKYISHNIYTIKGFQNLDFSDDF